MESTDPLIMMPILAVLEFGDFAIIAFIVLLFTGGAVYSSRKDMSLIRLQRQLGELQQKLDALLKYHGIEMPTPPQSDMSPELQLMAKDPHLKIAAIKRYREENPGVGLAEAKHRIEEFYQTGQ
jgi:ribosomal protein L7/L12